MRSSLLTRDCRKPFEWRSPASASSRAASSPSTLKYTRALRRSGDVSTPVTVTKPMRGSFRPAASCAERTSLTASFTLRILAPAILDHPPARNVNERVHSATEHFVAGDQAALHAHAVRELRDHVALELGGGVVDDRRRVTHKRRRERGSLPQIVVVRLGDCCPEALLQVRLQRLDLLALALEARVVGQVNVDLDEADEAYSSSRSTWRVSKTSSTSPSFTSW